MQKKWVELFEKVIGRKPSPEEFMAGKACGFDLKQIQSIAGNAPAEEVAPVKEPVVEPVGRSEECRSTSSTSTGLVATF